MAGPSIRELIMQAILAALDAVGRPCKVYRCQLDQLNLDDAQYAIVLLTPQFPEKIVNAEHGSVERHLTISVALAVKRNADDGESIDSMADPLYCWTVQQIMADQTLAGLCQEINETGTSFIARPDIETDTDATGQRVDFEIVYTTSGKDPAAA